MTVYQHDGEASALKRERGRPRMAAPAREAFYAAVWAMVYTELHRKHARGISDACRSLMSAPDGRPRTLRFVDDARPVFVSRWEDLRDHFNKAEKRLKSAPEDSALFQRAHGVKAAISAELADSIGAVHRARSLSIREALHWAKHRAACRADGQLDLAEVQRLMDAEPTEDELLIAREKAAPQR